MASSRDTSDKYILNHCCWSEAYNPMRRLISAALDQAAKPLCLVLSYTDLLSSIGAATSGVGPLAIQRIFPVAASRMQAK